MSSPSSCLLAGRALPQQLFRSFACAHCLFYIYFVTPPYSTTYMFSMCPTGLLICHPYEQNTCNCSTFSHIFNVEDYSTNQSQHRPVEAISVTPPLPPDFPFITRQCCEAAAKCCDDVLSVDVPSSFDERSCPATWDGWQCFSRSMPGTVRSQCPSYIFGDRLRNEIGSQNHARKKCQESGNWFTVHRDGENAEWTDYSDCIVEQKVHAKVIAGIFAFSLSVLALVPAIFILTFYRCLRTQPTFRIHRQLLISFLLLGVSYLFNCFFFVVDGAPGDQLYLTNHISCRLLFTIQLRYLRLSTSTWMLAEGVYLYRLLVSTFAEPESLRPYFTACWGFPTIVTFLYSICRQLFDNGTCWVLPSQIFWIEWLVSGPILAALSGNLILMSIILFILINKLRFNPHLEPVQYKKAVRAVFMLMPVFGLHFLFTIYRLPSYFYEILNLIMDGIQGFLVSMIVCYTNGRVQECIRKTRQMREEERRLSKQSVLNKERFKLYAQTSTNENNSSRIGSTTAFLQCPQPA